MEQITVTNWEKVSKNDDYLGKEWEDDNKKQARKLQKEGNLFIAYEVPAVSYALYEQMDAHQIFIDQDGNFVMSCEGVVIDKDHQQKWESEY